MDACDMALLGDKPGRNPETDDRLGHAPLAAHIARCIGAIVPSSSMVLGIHGDSGSGKTTLLNFVVHYVDRAGATLPVGVMHFHPEWYGPQQGLLRPFFREFGIAVTAGSDAHPLVEPLAAFLAAIGEDPSDAVPNRNAPILRDDLINRFASLNRGLVVVIDDIHRLRPDRWRELFVLVRSVANLPGIVYLVAFERANPAEGSPGASPGGCDMSADDVVHLAFEVPPAGSVVLRRLVMERLEPMLEGTPGHLLDHSRWSEVYDRGIADFIATPRDVVRLTDSLKTTYPTVKGNVNPVDFIGIEALRVFCPAVYRIVRDSSWAFAGAAEFSFADSRAQKLRQFHDEWLARLEPTFRRPVRELLTSVFPKLGAAWGIQHRGPEWLPSWGRELRACVPDLFPTYFVFARAEALIGRNGSGGLLARLSEDRGFSEPLEAFVAQVHERGGTVVPELLHCLDATVNADMRPDHLSTVLHALLDVGDRMASAQNQPGSGLEPRNEEALQRMIGKILGLMTHAEGRIQLSSAIRQGRAVSTMMDVLDVLLRDHAQSIASASRFEEQLFSREDLDSIDSVVVDRVRRAAESGELLQSEFLGRILERWGERGCEPEVRTWVKGTVRTDEGLVALLAGLLYTAEEWTATGGRRTKHRLGPGSVVAMLLESSIVDRAKKLLIRRQDLPEQQRIALKRLIKDYLKQNQN